MAGLPETIVGLAQEYLVRIRSGEAPSIEEYAESHPDLADEIRNYLPVAAMMESVALIETKVTTASSVWQRAPWGTHRSFRTLRSVSDYSQDRRRRDGAVYLAADSRLRRNVALKIPYFNHSDNLASERFEREARVMATVEHPHLCSIHDVGEVDGLPYISMSYIEGETLADWIRHKAEIHPEKTAQPLTGNLVLTLRRWSARLPVTRLVS